MLLPLYHLFHQFNSGVVLSAVLVLLCPHRHFLEHFGVGFQSYVQRIFQVGVHRNLSGDIAHGTEGEHPTVVAGYGVIAIDIGGHRHLMTFVDNTGIGNGITGGIIDDIPPELRLDGKHHCKEEQKQCYSENSQTISFD